MRGLNVKQTRDDDEAGPNKPRIGRPIVRQETRKEFSRRLNAACDSNANVPSVNKGRYSWLAREFEVRRGSPVHPESVRKWFEGITIPSEDRKATLAQILAVDYGWLTSGTGGQHPVKPRHIEASGPHSVPDPDIAKHLALGLVGVGGGTVGRIAESGPIHFEARIKGALYPFHAVLAESVRDAWRFTVPEAALEAFVLGIIPIGPSRFELVDLDGADIREFGRHQGAEFIVDMTPNLKTGDHKWRRIDSFDRRP